jgi:glutamate/tyrosine decarboxylase-like PLP-dependent enzyme
MPVDSRSRRAPIDLSAEEFRALGYALVDAVAGFYASLPDRPVTLATDRDTVRSLLGRTGIPAAGTPAAPLLAETAQTLFEHSLHNGHPRFMGYITSSAAPLGALADLLAAAVNPNVGLWDLSPVATEIEAQTIRWLAELIGYPRDCGGLMVSGGNMANLVAFFAARRARAPWGIREKGLYGGGRLCLYASTQTHTWIQKAADLSGLGTDAIRWIETDREQRLSVAALEAAIEADRAAGRLPFLVVGAAGTVGTGAIDPLPEIAAVCKRFGLWFHVDGAYGAPAACLPEAPAALKGLALADSVALDPHKWLYCPLEAGCTLVRDPKHLLDAYSFHPDYYRFESAAAEQKINYYEYGVQNSRGFRALKVWLTLKHLGRDAYVELLRTNIELAKRMFDLAAAAPELEARTHNLSLTTFRFAPPDLSRGDAAAEPYLNELNEQLVAKLQTSGELFLSNAVVDGVYLLRACIVNFRTSAEDIDRIVASVIHMGRELDLALRPASRWSRQ